MAVSERTFSEVFPSLQLNHDLRDLMNGVQVLRVTSNSARTLLHVYILAGRWIHKKNILKLI